MEFAYESFSPDDLYLIAKRLIDDHPDSRIFAFYGSMGAGKTTFIKVVSEVLHVTGQVTSPTFAIINQYDSKLGLPVYHFDFYRIKRLEEALDIGYEDYFFSGSYCLIEWPEMIEQLLPEGAVKVRIEVDDESGKRSFAF